MLRRLVIVALCFWFSLGHSLGAARATVDAQSLGDTFSSGRASSPSGVLSAGLESFKADLFTGSASFGIPVQIPPGTAGMQPNLALGYRSSRGNGWVGVGWSLGVPAIARSTKFGVPGYNDDFDASGHDDFVLGDDRLVELSAQNYATEIESYARITRFNRGAGDEYWEVARSDGRVLLFGDTPDTRIEREPGQIFAWLLHTETDTLGNGISYEYDKTADPGTAYLAHVSYTTHPGEVSMAERAVDFILESAPRPDPFVSYQAGFEQKAGHRLAEIRVTLSGRLVRRYDLNYITAQSGRSLLESVQLVGRDGLTPAPPQRFVYQTFATAFNPDSTWINPSAADNYVPLRPATVIGNADYAVLDLTGDGLPDRVTRDKQNDLQWLVYPNSGDGQGFANTPLPWANPSAGDAQQNRSIRRLSGSGDVLADLLDLDGDGKLDRVTGGLNGDKLNLRFFRNTGAAFDAGVDWPDATALAKIRKADVWSQGFSVYADILDMNGDGLPDRVETNDATSWIVYLNEGSGFSSAPLLWPVPAEVSGALIWDSGGTKADVFDINGDGLPDRILATDHNAVAWTVHFGTGTGFTPGGYAWPNPSHGVSEGDGTKIRDADASGNLRVAVLDMNGDGLVDRVTSNKQAGTFTVWPNTGMEFSSSAWTWNNPSAAAGHPTVIDVESQVTVADLLDMDGDHLLDRVASVNSKTPWRVYYSNSDPANDFTRAGKPDLLVRIENGLGGFVSLEYCASTKYTDATGALLNPLLPSPVITLAASTVDDGRGGHARTTYTYAGGRYDPASREFRGFGSVTVAGPSVASAEGPRRALAISDFNQSDQLKGTLSRLRIFEEIGGSSALMQETANAHVEDTLPPYEPLLHSTKTLTFDGNESFRMRKKIFSAYENGVPIEVMDLGEVTNENDPLQDGTADERVTRYEYVNGGGSVHLRLPAHVIVTSGDPANLQSERWFYYDNLPLGDASAGLLTKTEVWLSDPVDNFSARVTRVFTHDAFGNVVTARDPNGRVATTVYDDAYHTFPVATVLPPLASGVDGFLIARTFDSEFGMQLSETDLNGNVAHTAFDALGRTIGTFLTPAGENEITLSETRYHDELLGNPDDGGSGAASAQQVEELRFSAEGVGEILTSRVFFDGLGRSHRREATGPGGKTIVALTVYDAQGRVASASAPFFAGEAASWTTTEHDALGRPIRSVNPEGTFLVSTYDLWQRTDELFSLSLESLSMKSVRRDAFGHVVAVLELNARDPGGNPGPYMSRYDYDARGNLIAALDADGNFTSIVYDTLNRKVAIADPDAGNWRYEYDLAGNLTRRTDARGISVTFSYDALDRVVSRRWPGAEATFEYDSLGSFAVRNGLGRLVRASVPAFTQKFEYDAFGNVALLSYRNGYAFHRFDRSFDLLGREVSKRYPDGEVVTRTYDGPFLERIQSLHAPGGSYLIDASFDATGRPLRLEMGNGATLDYQYDPATTRLAALQAAGPEGPLLDLGYGYTPEGNVEAVIDGVDASRSQWLGYDSLGRLLSASGGYGDQAFRYDSLGNLVQKAGMILEYGPETGPTGGPHAVKSAGGKSFTYDMNGNVTAMGTRTFTYDGEGRLTQVHEGGKLLSRARYDAFGRRWKLDANFQHWLLGGDFEWNGNLATKTIFVAGQAIASRTAPHTPGYVFSCGATRAARASAAGDLAPFILLLALLALLRVSVQGRRKLQAALRTCGISFLIFAFLAATGPAVHALPTTPDGNIRQGVLFSVSDHLGSTSLVLDEAGGVVREVLYDPWGAIVASTGSVQMQRKFTGKRINPRTDLYYFGDRYYDPSIGRFLQADPLVPDPGAPQSLNRYAYVYNNPLRYTDPTGNFPFVAVLIGAFVGAGAAAIRGENPLVGALVGGLSGGIGGGVSAALGGGVSGAFVGGAAAGAVSSGVNATFNGESFLRGAVTGAFAGGFTGGASGLSIDGFGLEDLLNPIYKQLARVSNTLFRGVQLGASFAGGALNRLTFGRFSPGFARFQEIWNYPSNAYADRLAKELGASEAGTINGVKVYAADEVPFGAHAVVIGRRIFVPSTIEGIRDGGVDISVLNHELGHVAAFNLLGPLAAPTFAALYGAVSPIALGVALGHGRKNFGANFSDALYDYHPAEQLLIPVGSSFPRRLLGP